MEEKDKTLKWTKPGLKKISGELQQAQSADCGSGSLAATCTSVGGGPGSGDCLSGSSTAGCGVGTLGTCHYGEGAFACSVGGGL